MAKNILAKTVLLNSPEMVCNAVNLKFAEIETLQVELKALFGALSRHHGVEPLKAL